MKKIFCLTLFGSLPLVGQEAEQPSPLENAVVLDEVVFQKGKDQLVVQRIEEPELEAGQDDLSEAQPETPQPVPENALPTQTFLISATTYADQGTHLELWPVSRGRQAALSGWSNLDWSVFQAFHKFTDGQQTFQIMLFHSKLGEAEVNRRANTDDSERSYPQVPEQLPDLSETGARYLVTSPAETEKEDTLDFLEAIHKLYDENSQELKQDLVEARIANEERQRQIKLEAEKPRTRVLKIWRRSFENE
jgi:hypothetical protein